MKIIFNWPDYLIPFVRKGSQNDFLFDLFINSILFENDSSTVLRVTRVVIDLTRQNESLWRWELPLNALDAHLTVESKIGELPIESRQALVGTFLAQKIGMPTPGSLIKPGDQALLRRFPIRFATDVIPDRVVVRAFSGAHLIARSDIPIQTEVPIPEFVLPVTGLWQIINNVDITMGHRQFASQEFAFDLIQISPRGSVRYHKTESPDDYVCFGKPVLAMADGIVTEIQDGMVDHTAIDAESGFTELRSGLTSEYTKNKFGNYVQINHKDGTYSLYAHLKSGSILVQQDAEVKQAQQIAEVGNSGSCRSAHLHIQVNDQKDFMGSRSLPLQFINVLDVYNRPTQRIIQNNSLIHTS